MHTDQQFGEFMSARYASLVRTGYLLTGDRGLAEDLVQSALERTYLHWHRLRERESAEAYTRTTMVRLAIRWRRRRWTGEVPTGELPELADRDHAAAAEDADLMRRALLQLPVSQRAVLVLRFYADQSEAETAAALGCSLGTVKSRTYRALRTLRTTGVLPEPIPERGIR
jgi:RNA polymerase sigma-70 factor (sigma-E family)